MKLAVLRKARWRAFDWAAGHRDIASLGCDRRFIEKQGSGQRRGVTMDGNDETQHRFRELAHRATDGLEVMLFWHEATNELTVSVSDERTGAYFELAADPDEALEVFYHPYAHAAHRGVPYDEALLASWAEGAAVTHA
jgi:hypothetical protein